MNAQPFTLGEEVGSPPADVPPSEPMQDIPPEPIESPPIPPPPPKGRKTQIDQLEDDLANALSALAAGLVIVDSYDAEVVANGAEPLARALRNLAEKNPRVKARLMALMQAGVYGEVAIASLTILIPILVHHGLVPSNLPVGGFSAVQEETENE